MSLTYLRIKPAEFWIPLCVIVFIFFLLNTRLVFKECKTRKSKNITLTTKYLALWSILCMIFGSISLLFITLSDFPGVCYISLYLARIFTFGQPLTLEFYQLSRLYYCFARNQVYSNNGYPNWLFVIMFGVIIICYMILVFLIMDHYVISCGINNRYQAYENVQYFRNQQLYPYAATIAVAGYIIWDVITLMLYIFKIRMFTKSTNSKDDKVKNRILSILNKITIITLFYQFIAFLIGAITSFLPNRNLYRIVIEGLISLIFILYSYSIYIMMDHNKKSYQWFLKILYRFKLYFVCYCFCKKRLMEQLNEMRMDLTTINDKSDRDSHQQIEKTEYDTKMHDITVNHAKIEVRNLEFSVETTIC